jgi:hypothetical protein
MKAFLVLFGVVALTGLVWSVDTLLPGGPHLPEAVPPAALGLGALVTVGVLVAAHRSGMMVGPPRQWLNWTILLPTWARLVTIAIVVVLAGLSFTGFDRANALATPLGDLLIAGLGSLRARAVLRHRRALEPTYP